MQRVLTHLITIPLISAALSSCGSNESYTELSVTKGRERKKVCDITKVPDGWVIIENLYDIDCRNSPRASVDNNAYIIVKPGRREVICANSKVPKGYSVTEYGHSMACGGYVHDHKNNKTIERI